MYLDCEPYRGMVVWVGQDETGAWRVTVSAAADGPQGWPEPTRPWGLFPTKAQALHHGKARIRHLYLSPTGHA